MNEYVAYARNTESGCKTEAQENSEMANYMTQFYDSPAYGLHMLQDPTVTYSVLYFDELVVVVGC